jgi:hypothetical protein
MRPISVSKRKHILSEIISIAQNTQNMLHFVPSLILNNYTLLSGYLDLSSNKFTGTLSFTIAYLDDLGKSMKHQ